MNVKYLEKPKVLLDTAFRRARKESEGMKQERHKMRKTKAKAVRKIEVSANYLMQALLTAIDSVPQVEQLHPFYQEMIKITLDFGKMKQAISQFRKVRQIVIKQKSHHAIGVKKIGLRQDPSLADQKVKQFYGRVSSLIHSLDKNVEVYNREAKKFSLIPAVKELPSVILAGFPNTGKTSLLERLTTAKAKIASYPFTTQKIELGYFEERFFKVQVIDTPGLLDRPQEKRNPIEKKAVSALKHLSNAIVFVLDPTETCGYSLESQLGLLKEVKKQFKAPIIIALNKSDLAPQGDKALNLKKKFPKEKVIETGEGMPIDDLKKEILSALK
jgi:nucleolar GTP-binding protein